MFYLSSLEIIRISVRLCWTSGPTALYHMENSLKPIQVKLVLLGEAAVGKSSLVLRFVNGEFQDNKEPTIGAAFLTQKCKLDDKIIKYEIWDTAGRRLSLLTE